MYLQLLVPIIVAFIAGFLALYQVKLNVITSARVEWIQELRNTLSLYISEVQYLYNFIENTKNKVNELDDRINESGSNTEKEKRQLYENYSKELSSRTRKLDELINKIVLFLNNDESDQNKLESLLKDYKNKYHSDLIYGEITLKDLRKVSEECLRHSRIILKKEWDKTSKPFLKRWLEKI